VKSKYQTQARMDITYEAQSGDTNVKMDPAKERHEPGLKLCGWLAVLQEG